MFNYVNVGRKQRHRRIAKYKRVVQSILKFYWTRFILTMQSYKKQAACKAMDDWSG